ncbi:MAG: hypothetical protein E4H36_12870 [Spirochaetales bacterium]|nr:MAG: hypothetical protein E4H36_12870 [Spirochaetales bacterium]
MLKENKNVSQVEGEGFRRWFMDDFFDLIVWYNNEGGEIVGFQLCYDKTGNERALTWRKSGSTDHMRVDAGETPFQAKMTPVLVADGIFDSGLVLEKFLAASEPVGRDERDLVAGVLKDYSP